MTSSSSAILNDKQITELCANESPMIHPFVGYLHNENPDSKTRILSYGLSSYGYDVRLSRNVKIFHNLKGGVVDPKRFEANADAVLLELEIETDEDGSEYFILPPNSYMLGVTPEYFNIPRNVQVICLGKSTYARAGVLINCTPIEAGFKGYVVIEAANGTPCPIRVYVNEGIAQFLFFRGEECETSYADRKGKYQNQTGIQLPKV